MAGTRPLLRLTYDFRAVKTFARRVSSWKKDIQDLRWAWPVVGLAVAEYHRRVFASEGAVSLVGGVWAPLAELTVASRLRREQVSSIDPYDYLAPSAEGPEGKILHWSYRLRDSVTGEKPTVDSVRRGTRTSFTFGSNVPYGRLHQEGGTNAFGKAVPARPWLDYVGGPAVAVGILERALQIRMAGA